MSQPPTTPPARGAGWVFRAIADGIGAPTRRRHEPTVNKMMRQLYGTHKRRPDVKAAAEGLGVSAATVRRWLKHGLPQRGPNTDTLKDQHRAWLNTSAGRTSQIPVKTRQLLMGDDPPGMTFNFYGKIAISSDPRNNTPRNSTFTLSGEQAQSVLLAALSGDDAAAQAALEQGAADGFGGPPPDLEITSLSTDW